jgi:hypothetical protein
VYWQRRKNEEKARKERNKEIKIENRREREGHCQKKEPFWNEGECGFWYTYTVYVH